MAMARRLSYDCGTRWRNVTRKYQKSKPLESRLFFYSGIRFFCFELFLLVIRIFTSGRRGWNRDRNLCCRKQLDVLIHFPELNHYRCHFDFRLEITDPHRQRWYSFYKLRRTSDSKGEVLVEEPGIFPSVKWNRRIELSAFRRFSRFSSLAPSCVRPWLSDSFSSAIGDIIPGLGKIPSLRWISRTSNFIFWREKWLRIPFRDRRRSDFEYDFETFPLK